MFTRRLKTEESHLNWLENRFENLDNKLVKIISKCNYEDREHCKQMFFNSNPSYEKLKEKISLQRDKVNQIECDLNKRNEFLTDLHLFKNLIEKHVKQPQVA